MGRKLKKITNQPIVIIYKTIFGEIHFLESSLTEEFKTSLKDKMRVRPDLTEEELSLVIKQTNAILNKWRKND